MAINTTISGITPNSQELIDMYLESQNSIPTIMSALRKLVRETQKYNIPDIDYQDFCTYVKPFPTNQGSLQQSFIKFLYAYDFLNNKSGFEQEYWNPDEIVRNFQKDKTQRKSEEYKAALTFEQIENIHEFLKSISEDDYRKMRLALSYYLCFNTSINNIEDLKEADAKDYKDGIWTICEIDYDIPVQYEALLLEMQRSQRSKFSRLNSYIKELGEQVGIENLFPSDIMHARNNMHQMCFQCGKSYYVLNTNWTTVNGIIMCVECAKKIIENADVKKNYKLNSINSFQIIINRDLEQNMDSARALKSVEEVLPEEIDYIKLQTFLHHIGKQGEQFVYELERRKLFNTEFFNKVDPTPSLDHNMGFDILSYEINGEPVFIEVKTTTGDVNQPFYISDNELKKAKQTWDDDKKYKIYRVGNISGSPTLRIYEHLFTNEVDITNVVYRVSPKLL